jgi:hypothetical protein
MIVGRGLLEASTRCVGRCRDVGHPTAQSVFRRTCTCGDVARGYKFYLKHPLGVCVKGSGEWSHAAPGGGPMRL